MGAQYPIMGGAGLTGPTWYRMGTFSASSGVRMLRLDLLMQSPVGSFLSARLHFSTNDGAFAQNTYDTPPVAFNAYADMQTTSPDWSSPGTDIVVTQLSNTSYAFFARVTPDNGVGFFTVYHATGDAFTFVGSSAGASRPANGVYPMVSQPFTPDQIGAASNFNPTVTGTLTCADLTSTGLTTLRDFSASGICALPNNALAIESISGLIPALNTKASLGAAANFTSCTLSGSLNFGGNIVGGPNTNISAFQLNASGGFNSTSGTAAFAAGVSQTIYTFAAGSGNMNRGFVVVEAGSPNNSTTLAFFDALSQNTFVTILARQGNNNAGSTNLGTANTGTYNMSLFCNSSGNLRLSLTSAGTASWSIIFI